MQTKPNETHGTISTMKNQRQLTDHKVNGLNEALDIYVMDEPGAGGANHRYLITIGEYEEDNPDSVEIHFQEGPIKDAGVNGISIEAIMALALDRLRGFQYATNDAGERTTAPGPFACRENALALTHLEEALMWLQKRTRDRMSRGVEGTMAK